MGLTYCDGLSLVLSSVLWIGLLAGIGDGEGEGG